MNSYKCPLCLLGLVILGPEEHPGQERELKRPTPTRADHHHRMTPTTTTLTATTASPSVTLAAKVSAGTMEDNRPPSLMP